MESTANRQWKTLWKALQTDSDRHYGKHCQPTVIDTMESTANRQWQTLWKALPTDSDKTLWKALPTNSDRHYGKHCKLTVTVTMESTANRQRQTLWKALPVNSDRHYGKHCQPTVTDTMESTANRQWQTLWKALPRLWNCFLTCHGGPLVPEASALTTELTIAFFKVRKAQTFQDCSKNKKKENEYTYKIPPFCLFSNLLTANIMKSSKSFFLSFIRAEQLNEDWFMPVFSPLTHAWVAINCS